MNKKEKLELAELIAKTVVEALKANSTTSQQVEKGRKSSNEGVSTQTPKNPKNQKKLTIADFEPNGSKSEKGYENWASYDAQRTKYCYFVATNGEITDGKIFGTKWYRKVDFSENSKYYKAKAKYEAKYHYVKKADR